MIFYMKGCFSNTAFVFFSGGRGWGQGRGQVNHYVSISICQKLLPILTFKEIEYPSHTILKDNDFLSSHNMSFPSKHLPVQSQQ